MTHTSRYSDSLRASLYDGVWWAAMMGFGNAFIAPLAVSLDASAQYMAFLGTLPAVISAVCQLIGVKICERGSGKANTRKGWVFWSAIAQAAAMLCIGALPFEFFSKHLVLAFLLILTVLHTSFCGMGEPLWASLMGDIVDERTRGTYFGFRNKWIWITQVLATLLAGAGLYYAKQYGSEHLVFALLFLIAAASRLISAYWLAQYEDPIREESTEPSFSLWQFLSRFSHSNFARFTVFSSLFGFGHAIAGPLFAVYMLRDLQQTYWEYTVLSVTQPIAQFFFVSFWGRRIDKHGAKWVLSRCAFGVSMCPLNWLFSGSMFWLIPIQVYAGFMWSGLLLATTTFLFDCVSPAKRARCYAYFAIVTTAGATLGGFIGGQIVTLLKDHPFIEHGILGHALFGELPKSAFFQVFLLSGILRLGVCATLLGWFEDGGIARKRHQIPVAGGDAERELCQTRVDT